MKSFYFLTSFLIFKNIFAFHNIGNIYRPLKTIQISRSLSNFDDILSDFNSNSLSPSDLRAKASLDIHSNIIEQFINNLNLQEKKVINFETNGFGVKYTNNKIDILEKFSDIELLKYNVYNINIVTKNYTNLPHFQVSTHSFGRKIIVSCDLIPKKDYFIEPKYLKDYYEEFYNIKKLMTKNLINTDLKNIYTEATFSPVALSFTLYTEKDLIDYSKIIIKYVDLYCNYLMYENELYLSTNCNEFAYGNLENKNSFDYEREILFRKTLFENAPGFKIIKNIFKNDLEIFKYFSLL
jgi:hypothetical protein